MINRSLFANPYTWPEVVLWWKQGDTETEIRLHDLTIHEAYDRAVAFGYKPPVWYKPWQYITGGLGILTLGFGYIKK
jgi:hypothetical protein